MTVCFVTGTDTGVGKTVVTAALAAILRARGKKVAVVKPAQTGVQPGEAGDVDEVCRLAGPVDVREGARVADPLAPDRAALVAGVELPGLRDQLDLILGSAAGRDDVLVEGAGGVTVNLGKTFGLLDIAGQVSEAGQPITWIVVARAGLGTLNHSNLTVWAIQDRGFSVQGIVIGSWPTDPGPAERYNRDDLAFHTGVPVLGAVPEGAAALPPADFQAQAPGWIQLYDRPAGREFPTAPVAVRLPPDTS
jgi:dethiobiotin synthetase